MRTKKHFWLILTVAVALILTSAVILTGCSGGNSTPSGPQETPEARETPPAQPLPDLTFLNIAWSPYTPNFGEGITFTVYIGNGGTVPADPTQLLIEFWSPGGDHESVTQDTGTIPPDETVKIEVEGVTPSSSGEVMFKIEVDPEDSLNESNEDNNMREFTITILE